MAPTVLLATVGCTLVTVGVWPVVYVLGPAVLPVLSGGATWKVQRYSSLARVNIRVLDANGSSPVIGWGFGEYTNVVGAVRGLAIG